jgi:hypothetical protein
MSATLISPIITRLLHVTRWRNRRGREGDYVYVSPSVRERRRYRVTVEFGHRVYVGESSAETPWSFNPLRLGVGREVPTCVQGDRLVITRPDGQLYRPRLVRAEVTP